MNSQLQNITILLFGNDQVGKTCTGNVILNYEGLRKINYNNQTDDPVCNFATTEDIRGKLISVIDTPGFVRSRRRVIEVIRQKKDELSSVSGTFSVLFVVRANHVSDRDCSESIQSFEEVFGRQFSGRTIVVVTHLDKMGGNINFKTFLGSCGAQLRSFIRERNLGVCFFDNLTGNSDIRKSQVKNVISMIESKEKTWSWNFLSAAVVVAASIALVAIYAAKH